MTDGVERQLADRVRNQQAEISALRSMLVAFLLASHEQTIAVDDATLAISADRGWSIQRFRQESSAATIYRVTKGQT
jgi:hypothetical protein